jgi:hypothetical protein
MIGLEETNKTLIWLVANDYYIGEDFKSPRKWLNRIHLVDSKRATIKIKWPIREMSIILNKCIKTKYKDRFHCKPYCRWVE